MSRLVFARSFSSSTAFVAAVVVCVSFVGVLGLSARGVSAQGAASDSAVIEYRQLVMGAVGSHMGAIGGILKNQLDRPGAIANHAQQMADSAKLMGPAFRQKVVAGKTDSKSEIWSDWAKFEKSIADYEKAAMNLATAAKGSDPAAVGLAVRALGESCGGCHESFRKPKEQSYKNQ